MGEWRVEYLIITDEDDIELNDKFMIRMIESQKADWMRVGASVEVAELVKEF